MSKVIQAVRGMNDILPSQSPFWQLIENTIRQLTASYGYQEIRFPIVESTKLFKRSIGDVTDIVEKEMYTFEDRNGDSLSLRPEGTAGCVRAGIENGMLYNQQQRLWYCGPMYRHERPQKGRYRQFFQFGMEAFGMQGPDIDAEQVLFMKRLFKSLSIDDRIVLQINTLGHLENRNAYRVALVEYFSRYENDLDEDSKRRLHANPLRILDSKNPDTQKIVADAPVMKAYLDSEANAHFDSFCQLLSDSGIAYEHNPRLVRGLDYYGLTIYEWITDCLGAQGTVCAGGRYNRLVEQLGGKATPAVGFAMGLERIVTLVETVLTPGYSPDIYIVLDGEQAVRKGMLLAEQMRSDMPQISIMMNCGGGSIKSQFKRADKSNAKIALILGEDELSTNTCSVKFLRDNREQVRFSVDELASQVLGALAE